MNKINVTIDKRTELCGILLRLSDYKTIAPHLIENNPKLLDYQTKAEEYFKSFKSHKAVNLLNEILHSLPFGYDAPPLLFLNLDNAYNFVGENNYPFVERLKQSPLVLEFLKEVKSFAKDSNFETFYNENRSFYEKYIIEMEDYLKTQSVLQWQENFLNSKSNKTFVVNLLPLQSHGGYGGSVGNIVYCNESASKRYSTPFISDKFWYSSHILHEFMHSTINPLTASHATFVNKLYFEDSAKEQLAKQAYTDNQSYINESVIRAIQAIYMRDIKVSNTDLENYISIQKKNGFYWIETIIEELEKYKQNPNRNLEEYYPNLLSSISKTLSENQKNKN